MSEPPVEVTTRYVTTVDDIAGAWAFVMDRLDRVGPDPSVSIRPLRVIGAGDMLDGLEGRETPEPVRQFEVVVEGMVTEGERDE